MTIRWRAIPLLTALALGLAAQTREFEGEREHWQRLDEIFKSMGVAPGAVMADIGAGDGFLTVRLAPLLSEKGHLYAVDLNEAKLDGLKKRLADAHIENVEVVKGDASDPHLPAGHLDAVVILNAYHEMTMHQEILRRIHQALKSGGRLVIAEPSPASDDQTRAQQVEKHRISAALVAAEMADAGFTGIDTQEKFTHGPGSLLYYSLVVGRRGE